MQLYLPLSISEKPAPTALCPTAAAQLQLRFLWILRDKLVVKHQLFTGDYVAQREEKSMPAAITQPYKPVDEQRVTTAVHGGPHIDVCYVE